MYVHAEHSVLYVTSYVHGSLTCPVLNLRAHSRIGALRLNDGSNIFERGVYYDDDAAVGVGGGAASSPWLGLPVVYIQCTSPVDVFDKLMFRLHPTTYCNTT
jgi:hypothetical protein